MEPGEGERRTPDHKGEISLDWLIRLRWGAVLGQILTVVVARALLGTELPLGRLLILIAVLAASNALLAAIRPRFASARGLCGAALTLDTLLLSGLLHATGGPYNPFGVALPATQALQVPVEPLTRPIRESWPTRLS